MKMISLLASIAGMFASTANNVESDRRRIRTNRNPHNFTRFEVAPNFFISAVNIQSAEAQYNKIMAKKAMRLEKSNAKVCAS
jgi:hypothetical protein